MDQSKIMDMFRDYIDNMKEIRLLSTPALEEVENADQYGTLLKNNFARIGELAAKNRVVINDIIKPLAASEEKLSEEIQSLLVQFDKLLMNEEAIEEVDMHLSELIGLILTNNELKNDAADESGRVISIARQVKRDYFIISSLNRFENKELEDVRSGAMENLKQLSRCLEKDVFCTLSPEAKGAAMQFTLTGALLYESNFYPMPDEWWEEALSIIERSEEFLKDPFYRQQAPDFDWETHELRTYYYGAYFAHSYIPKHIAKRVYEYSLKTIDFLKKCKNEALVEAVGMKQAQDLNYMSAVLAGHIPAREGGDHYYQAYKTRDTGDYSVAGVNQNLDTPSMYMRTVAMSDLKLCEEDFDRYREITESSLDYLCRIPKSNSIYLKCAILLGNIAMYFEEVPGGLTMEEFCLNAFAAIHPPTFVHSNMVARLSECMARHLIEDAPELFIGFPGCGDAQQVLESKSRILRYTYHAALCHDLGKLFVIDTISMYGRNLLDDEFIMIKNHPVIGALVASMHESTREYEDVIKGHHLWYDCSRGYPADFDTAKSPYKTVIDIVMAADCLDAATDIVGRSYNKGKTFADYEKEVQADAGTRYAPFLVTLFEDPDLRKDIEYLLSTGRRKMYRDVFFLLK